MISVRLSEDEYHELRDMCASHEARSVSEMARKAMQTILGQASGRSDDPALLNLRVQELLSHVSLIDGRLNHLDRELSRLNEILNKAQVVS
ncbi:MAG: hypothetical protein LAQ30_25025 [Acidobacteriia bacterium]|nr:hypothetical protein [Terriglobia bacterium]